MNDTIKIGIIFQASFSRAASEAGFVKGMLETVDRRWIHLMSASSTGSFNALAISTNTLDTLEHLYRSIDFVNRKNLKLGLKNKAVEDLTDALLQEGKSIEIPFYVSATTLFPFPCTSYFRLDETTPRENIRKIINLSTAFPFINGISKKEFHHNYLDGVLTDKTPYEPIQNSDCDMLIILGDNQDYLPPSHLLNGKRMVVYVDTTLLTLYPFPQLSFSRWNLNLLFDVGYQYGKIFGQMVFKDNDYRENLYAFIQDEIGRMKARRIHELPKSHILEIERKPKKDNYPKLN